jgi:hypothetical protein
MATESARERSRQVQHKLLSTIRLVPSLPNRKIFIFFIFHSVETRCEDNCMQCHAVCISHSIASEGGCVRRTARTSEGASRRTRTFLDRALCSDCVRLTPCTLDCAHSCEVHMFTIVSSRYRTPPTVPTSRFWRACADAKGRPTRNNLTGHRTSPLTSSADCCTCWRTAGLSEWWTSTLGTSAPSLSTSCSRGTA